MKKYFLLGLIVAIVPNICFGGGARYTQLVREKQRKMEELEKCMGSSKGLKIAGLSTIGLTAVGVAGNIAEAQKLQEYDDAIAKKNKDIEAKQKAIVAEQEKIAKKQQEKSNPTPAPIDDKQQQCINRVNGEFTVGIPSKYQDSYPGLKKELDDLLEEVVDEDGGMIWYGYRLTCKKGTKLKECDGVDDFLQGAYKNILKAAVTDKECGTHLFNEIEEPKFLDSTDVADDNLTNNDKNILRNLVNNDIANIENTEAKLGAKIYISGYTASLVPGELGEQLMKAYVDFNTRCSDLGEGYAAQGDNDKANDYDEQEELDLDSIVENTTPYILSECSCFTSKGYEKQGDKCVKK